MRRVALTLLLMLAVACIQTAGAQKKGTAKKSGSTSAKAPAKKSKAEDIPPVREVVEAPQITFDTTASPNDTLTARITRLLELTRAMENDVKMVERSLGESFSGEMADNPMVQTFKKRFMEEMREGRARRWMTNLYIRQYRSIFTADEIQTLINFYQTPQGYSIMQKQIVLTGGVMSEARKIGEYLGGTLMQEIIQEQSKK